MPTPREGESRDDFLERCIPMVLDDGTAEDQEQAVAVCSSMWEQGQEGEQEGKMIRKTVPIQIKKKTKNGGSILISTGDLDRDRDRVLPQGANIQDYLRNPVVQYGHIYHEPWATIGRTTSLTVNDKGISAEFELRPAANEQDPQNIVRLLWEGEWIRTASIGFVPVEAQPNDEGGQNFTNWQLLEWSLVPVPANQNALRMAVKALGENTPDKFGPPYAGLDDLPYQEAEITHLIGTQTLDIVTTNDCDSGTATYWAGPFDWGIKAEDVRKRIAEIKRGRILSATNEKKLRQARDILSEVISQVEEIVDDEKGAHQSDSEPESAGIATKVVIPYAPTSPADEGASWSGAGARRRLRDWAGGEDWSPDKYKRGFVYIDGDADLLGSYKGPHHDIMDGTLKVIWAGVRAAMGSLVFGARGGRIGDESTRRSVYNHLSKHYRQWDKDVPEFRDYDEAELKQLFPELFLSVTEPITAEPDKASPDDDTQPDAGMDVMDMLNQFLDAVEGTLRGNENGE